MNPCPSFDGCDAAVCPLTASPDVGVMVRGERVCRMLRHAARCNYERIPAPIRSPVQAFALRTLNGEAVIRIGSYRLKQALERAMIPDPRWPSRQS